MRSFFGLKIRGEKKKKPIKNLKISVPPPPQDLGVANGSSCESLDTKDESNSQSQGTSLRSPSRQDSAPSTPPNQDEPKELGIAPASTNKLSLSMAGLSKPTGLRHHASNPGFGTRWNAGSSSSPTFSHPDYNPRPSTSDGERKTRVNPLDTQFPRGAPTEELRDPLSPPATARESQSSSSIPIPKSPLGEYELKLDLPNDLSTFTDFGAFRAPVEAPAPLRIRKQASTRVPSAASKRFQPSQNYPTPPHTGDDREVLETQMSGTQSQNPHSHGNFPAAFQELEHAISSLGPSTLPSRSCSLPASQRKYTSIVPRSASRATRKGSCRPIIQNVCAKRDTLTINAQRRRSLQMKIEAAESCALPSPAPVETPKPKRVFERPPPLNLSSSATLSKKERDGPRSAPFLQNPPRLFTSISTKSPLEIHVGTQERSKASAPITEVDELGSGVDSPIGSSIYTDDDDDDDDDNIDRPSSPESTSPVIPLTGPLASPCFPPLSQSPHSYFPTMPQNDATNTDQNSPPAIPPIPPRSLRRGPPSPLVATFGQAALSPFSMDPKFCSESETDSFDIHKPLELPRMQATRSISGSSSLRPFGPQRAATTAGHSTTFGFRRPQTAGQPNTGAQFEDRLKPPPPMPLRTKTEASKRPSSRIREKASIFGNM